MSRSFLFLQGPASPFFSWLATALSTCGHRVCRVNFCGGDRVYSGRSEVLNYRHRLEHLADWYRHILEQRDFSDVVMFGDCRAVHRPMHVLAEMLGRRVHVFEEGYMRPYWVTLEQHGVNGRSRLPRDPAWYLARHSLATLPEGLPTGYNVYELIRHNITYRMANALFQHQFPYYETHRHGNAFQEYAGLARRALHHRIYRCEAERVTEDLLARQQPYYLFPLQLNSDAQVTVHSPFDGVCEAISAVLHSFAHNAPSDAWLVIKNHPLDTGLIAYRRFAATLAEEIGLEKRLCFIDAGHNPTLLEHARGVVVINSTMGLSALHHQRPLVALGTAIYALPGLTWQGKLDDFWGQEEPPDMHLYRAFLDYIQEHTQINGNFYTRTGIRMAVAGAVERLEAQT